MTSFFPSLLEGCPWRTRLRCSYKELNKPKSISKEETRPQLAKAGSSHLLELSTGDEVLLSEAWTACG